MSFEIKNKLLRIDINKINFGDVPDDEIIKEIEEEMNKKEIKAVELVRVDPRQEDVAILTQKILDIVPENITSMCLYYYNGSACDNKFKLSFPGNLKKLCIDLRDLHCLENLLDSLPISLEVLEIPNLCLKKCSLLNLPPGIRKIHFTRQSFSEILRPGVDKLLEYYSSLDTVFFMFMPTYGFYRNGDKITEY